MSNIENFGSELLRMMGVAGISNTELSRKSGVSMTSIGSYVTGMAVPRIGTLRKLDKCLPGLSWNWSGAVQAYHRRIRENGVRAMHEATKGSHRGKIMDVSRPSAKKEKATRIYRVGPKGSLAEVARAAKKAGMTYGQYVGLHSYEVKG